MHYSDRIVLDHLDRLTDDTGLIQHAIYALPRRESGYTTDDNARALRLCTRLWMREPNPRALARVANYLSFLEFARCPAKGFHNFMSYQRSWLDAAGSGDCQGQAVRALAEVLGSSLPEDNRHLARELLDEILPLLADLRSLRAQAYIILAWGHLWTAGVDDLQPWESVSWSAAQRLVESYRRALRPDWQWFESHMTYANAVLPHALFVAAKRWPKEAFGDVAQESFAFLDRQTTADDFFWPVGNSSWCSHPEGKSPYDQQPVEAVTMAEAALAAHDWLPEKKYLDTFARACRWFHGHNSLHLPIAHIPSGACFDGLQSDGVNRNQGAESTLSYLSTQLLHLEQAMRQPAADSLAG